MKINVNFGAMTPHLIPSKYADGFKPFKGTMSDFWYQSLCLFGDMIRSGESYDNVFVDNQYWWDDGNKRYSVYMTENGILMYKSWDDNKLYRIDFDGNVSKEK